MNAAGAAWQAGATIDPRRRTLAFVVVALAFVLDLLDATIVNVALPSIEQSLHASGSTSSWVVAGYVLALSVLLITGGRLGDVWGYRRMFLWGVALFSAASLACGMAPTAQALVTARVAQGACGALMVPQVMALMQVMYAPHERLRAFSVFGLLGGVSAALGPVLGGLLIDANWWGLGWRLIFLVNLPIGVLAWSAGLSVLPHGKSELETEVDSLGTLWCVAAALAWVWPLMQAPDSGWSWPLLVTLLTAPLWTVLLVRHVRRLEAAGGSPAIPSALFRLPQFSRGLLLSLCVNGVVPGYVFVLTFTWQHGLGLSASHMALLCMPIALGAMFGIAWLGRRMHAQIGNRTIVVGLILQAASITLMWVVCDGRLGSPATLAFAFPTLLAQLLMGVGLGLVGPALTTAMLAPVPLSQAGAASGVSSSAQQFAGVLSIALVSASMMGAGMTKHPAAPLLLAAPGLMTLLVFGAMLAWRL